MNNFKVVLNLTNEQVEILKSALSEAIYQQRTAENALGGSDYSEKYHDLCRMENIINSELYRALAGEQP